MDLVASRSWLLWMVLQWTFAWKYKRPWLLLLLWSADNCTLSCPISHHCFKPLLLWLKWVPERFKALVPFSFPLLSFFPFPLWKPDIIFWPKLKTESDTFQMNCSYKAIGVKRRWSQLLDFGGSRAAPRRRWVWKEGRVCVIWIGWAQEEGHSR